MAGHEMENQPQEALMKVLISKEISGEGETLDAAYDNMRSNLEKFINGTRDEGDECGCETCRCSR